MNQTINFLRSLRFRLMAGGAIVLVTTIGVAVQVDLYRNAELLLWFAVLVVVGLLATLGGWFLVRDLARLRENVAGLTSGQVAGALPMTVPSEVSEVAQVFNDMARTLGERLAALEKSEARFHAIADYTYGVEAWVSPEGRLIWINRAVERVTAFTPEECLRAGDLIGLTIHEKDRAYAGEQFRRALQERTAMANFEVRLCRKDDAVVWAMLNWQPIYGPAGIYEGLRLSVVEIQARREAQAQLLETVAELRRAQGLKEHYLGRANAERARLDALLNVLAIGVLFVDDSHRVLFSNRAFRLIWGFPADDNLSGMRDAVLLERTAALRADDVAFRRQLEAVLARREPSPPFEVRLADGRVLTAASNLVPAAEPGRYGGRVWIYEDITERKRTAEQLLQAATRDSLTNLYNRRRFHEELDRLLAEADRRNIQVGLLILDLDGFKPINDQYGHQAGDRALAQLASEVGATIRRNEMLFRLGGDEFAVLATDTDLDAMVGLARRIGGQIAAMRFDVGGGVEARMTASQGISLYPRHASSAEGLVACADRAMYAAKASGKNAWRTWDASAGS